MVGHCGGLRQSQSIGDYVLAHGYLRRDRILDDLIPPEVPIPALAEVQVALQRATAQVTGDAGDALKQRLRTGTVVTYDDRNWELRWSQERRRINLSRAIAVDMESGTLAAQGYRLRVPYGTLLCVSDKPLHGEIKLPGAANAFYERAVGEHLAIGLAALDILRGDWAGCIRASCAASTSRRSGSLPAGNPAAAVRRPQSSRWTRSMRSWRSCASIDRVAIGRAIRRFRPIGSPVSSQKP